MQSVLLVADIFIPLQYAYSFSKAANVEPYWDLLYEPIECLVPGTDHSLATRLLTMRLIGAVARVINSFVTDFRSTLLWCRNIVDRANRGQNFGDGVVKVLPPRWGYFHPLLQHATCYLRSPDCWADWLRALPLNCQAMRLSVTPTFGSVADCCQYQLNTS